MSLRPSAFLKPFSPAVFPYARFGLTLAIGIAAGFVFQAFSIPLPWMLGPMVACLIAVFLHVPVAAPAPLRPPMTAIIGVMLGGSFSPSLLAQVPQWTATLLAQLVLLVLLAVIGIWYYRQVAGLDPVTAYYSGMPGGMLEMSLLGEEQGGDGQAIILIHSARVLFIIGTVPFLVQYLEHVQLGPRQATALSVWNAPWATFLWIPAVALFGSVLGRLLRLPVPALFGPMALSVVVHAMALTDFVMPRELVVAAQLIMGCVVGCRFIGYDQRAIIRILALSVGATALTLAATIAFSMVISQVFGVSLSRALLAFAPAGIAEMSLIAIALHFEIGFILVHQLARLILVASTAGPIQRMLQRYSRSNRPTADTVPDTDRTTE